ncbi:hypothetical protein JOC78_003106 [Bacillus ectoiniformans]|uniref:YppF family protein n=1 Tax=Bacillus ectoiniformans TaxID=1494429 RepID=UPI00195F18E7|nr:YppF family protein [Bacillus ectoiniformans]MBM7650122.1 hypothetical protein [Bacillus ectoiniformans]
MLLEDLIIHFILLKKQLPKHANDLLDHIQKSYLLGDLSLLEYKCLLFELEQRGAEKPGLMAKFQYLVQSNPSACSG